MRIMIRINTRYANAANMRIKTGW